MVDCRTNVTRDYGAQKCAVCDKKGRWEWSETHGWICGFCQINAKKLAQEGELS